MAYDLFNEYRFGVHQKVVNSVGNEKKVLDVGCAEGVLSKKMSDNKCEIVGIEIDELSAQKANRYCQKVIIGNVESLELEDKYLNYFDFIIFADILEHLKEPLKTLCRFKKYLNENGHFIISLPNVANWRMRFKLLFGNFDYKENGLLDKTHLRFFNLKSTKKLISEAGLEIVKFDITLNGVNKFSKIIYTISKYWPNSFAYQFFIIAKEKNSES